MGKQNSSSHLQGLSQDLVTARPEVGIVSNHHERFHHLQADGFGQKAAESLIREFVERGLFATEFLDGVDNIGRSVPARSRVDVLVQKFGRIEQDGGNELASVAGRIEERDLGVGMQVQVEAILLVGLEHIISLRLRARLHPDSDRLTRLNTTYLLQGSWEITHETASIEECSWDLLFTDIVGHICFGVEVREVCKLAVGHCKLSISVHFDHVRQTYRSPLPAWGMVDQMSKETPVALQISAMFFPCVTSISLDIYSQSFGKAISQCVTSLVQPSAGPRTYSWSLRRQYESPQWPS